MKNLNFVVELTNGELVNINGGEIAQGGITSETTFGYDVGYIIGWTLNWLETSRRIAFRYL